MTIYVAHERLLDFTREVLERSGCDARQTEVMAAALVWADRVGRAPEGGVGRLPIVSRRLRSGAINGRAVPRLTARSASTALLDADGGSGQYAGVLAMDAACELAAEQGVGAVGVFASNHLGAAAYFVHRAAERGMVSLAASNSFPKVAAHGGLRSVLGTNPFAFGAPQREGRSLLVDMATSALAGYAVRLCQDAGQPLPEGLAIDASGAPLRDPAALPKGALLPFAGPKGFGLALLVELLAGVITGAAVATEVNSMFTCLDAPGRNGHFFLALDLRRWMSLDDYFARFDRLVATLRASGATPEAVRYPGEARWRALALSDARGVPVDDNFRPRLEALAQELALTVPW
jgi:ureidoglycolate dehydrogenase (NAD+)